MQRIGPHDVLKHVFAKNIPGRSELEHHVAILGVHDCALELEPAQGEVHVQDGHLTVKLYQLTLETCKLR